VQNLGHASLSRVNLKQTRGRYGHKPIEFILISMPSNQSQSKTLGPRPLVNMMISFSTWMTVGSPTIQFLGRQVSGLYSGIICYVQGAILRFEFIMLANTSIGRFKVFGRFWVRGSDQGLYISWVSCEGSISPPGLPCTFHSSTMTSLPRFNKPGASMIGFKDQSCRGSILICFA
jgi:hypothetical protein